MTDKKKNGSVIAVILAVAAALWLATRTGGTGHTAVLRYGVP